MSAAKLVRITETTWNNLKQLIVKAIGGYNITYTTETYSEYGDDSRPIDEVTAIRLRTEADGDEAIIGYLLKDRLAEVGEKRLYATDEVGEIKFVVWLRNDGTCLQGDSNNPVDYTNFAVKFNELKTEFNSLKASYNDLVAKVNANATLLGTHTHPYINVAAPAITSPSGVAGQSGSTNNANIDNAKNTKIKYN